MSSATAAVAVGVDGEEAGVLSLLEDHSSLANDISTNVPLMTDSPAAAAGEALPEEENMVVSHDPSTHQARAIAALQQAANTTSEHHRHLLGPSTDRPTSQPRVQGHATEQQFSVQTMTRTPIQNSSPAQAVVGSGVPAVPVFTATNPHSICLCQAPARIPRPRNAFILFRQHHHAAVVAQNPGKSNPEISKIIGQMWKTSTEETKIIWQGHADAEKRQHLQRYPQYRYQPRRNGKKNAVPVDPTAPPPSMESVVCPNCGGRTGAISTPQAPFAAEPSRKPPHASRQPNPTRRQNNIQDDGIPGTGVTVEQAGVEALLQLGLQPEEDDLSSGLGSPSKRQRLNPSISPPVSGPLLPPGLYDGQFAHAPDPNIDPYFRQGSIDHDSPTTSLEHESSSQPLPQFNTAQISADVFSIKAMPILKKIHALNRICPPISSPAVPPFNTFATTRMPIISLDGDDVDVVGELFHAVAQELEKTESVHLIDEPDELTVLSEAYLEGLLSNAGLEKDKETDDADAARYLSHVAFWRRKAAGIRRVVTTGCASADRDDGQEEVFPRGTPQLVLINRYILSRSDAAALRLSTDGLSSLEHWQWCASLWRSCVGCDMTIYVQTLPEGSLAGSDAVESKDDGKVLLARKSAGGKEWGEKVVRRLGFEIGEMVRSLRGFPV